MRLIDADALNSEMYRKSFEVNDGRNVWNSGLWIRYKIFEEAIKDAPTIDAVPVKHGRWIKNDNSTYTCSECQSWIPNEQHYYARYCLHCGAKMDGKKNDR